MDRLGKLFAYSGGQSGDCGCFNVKCLFGKRNCLLGVKAHALRSHARIL